MICAQTTRKFHPTLPETSPLDLLYNDISQLSVMIPAGINSAYASWKANVYVFLPVGICYNFQFKNVNEETTLSIIDKRAPNISYGLDDISSKLLRQLKLH